MRKRIFLVLVTILGAPLILLAQDDGLFTTLDADKDGFVTKDEVPEDRRRLFERLVRSNDKNSDGKLSREEFTAKAEPPRDAAPDRGAGGDVDPGEIFKRLDSDGDGKLTKEELPGRIRENFARIDLNSDGHIALAEFHEVSARLGAGPGRPAADAASEAQTLFERLDGNKDGKLATDEVPEERREALLRAIARIDTDGDKTVNAEEFAKVYALMRAGGDRPPDAGPAPSSGPVPLIRLLDADGNGEISAEEIANASKALLKLDRNGDGKLTRDELQPPPGGGPDGRHGPEQVLRRLKEADRNGDGKIQKDEAPPAIATIFERADRNGDGDLDEAEVKGAVERLSLRREGGDRPREQPKPRD